MNHVTPDMTRTPQLALIDFLKAVAAQLIVLHHLAFYGPMADHVRPVATLLIGWLDSQARIAVQVFLVIGGFLAAKSMSASSLLTLSGVLGAIRQRYLKLVPPFMVATMLAAAASAWAGQWMTHYSISALPDLPQMLAHALLLHSILGYESVSAGAWYVAIDFQLHGVFLLMAWLCWRIGGRRRQAWLLPLLLVTGLAASLLHFNRNPDWDVWAPYFFGSYALGILAWWAGDPARSKSARLMLVAAMLMPAFAALAIDFRSRIAVALIIACMLLAYGRRSPALPSGALSVIHRLGRESYSVFLVHFPVSLVINAGFTRFAPPHALWQAGGMLLAWLASVAAGAAFYRWVEMPLARRFASHGNRRTVLQGAS